MLYETSFEDFSAANLARCTDRNGFDHPLDSWTLNDWMVATLGELGEAANIAKKIARLKFNHAPDRILRMNKGANVFTLELLLAKELGDTMVYLDLLAQSRGYNILDLAVEVFNGKSKEIGYPVVLK